MRISYFLNKRTVRVNRKVWKRARVFSRLLEQRNPETFSPHFSKNTRLSRLRELFISSEKANEIVVPRDSQSMWAGGDFRTRSCVLPAALFATSERNNCWRALARELSILYNSEKRFVGCKIGDMSGKGWGKLSRGGGGQCWINLLHTSTHYY